MKNRKNNSLGIGNVWLGIASIVFGFLMALDRFQWMYFGNWWTLIIIVPCVWELVNKKTTRFNIIGAVVGGALFLTQNFPIFTEMFWPILFVGIGAMLITIPTKESTNEEFSN